MGFDFKDKVKITDKSALVSKVKDADLLLDIDRSLQQSNKYFRSFGDETLKGMPKGSAASDFVLGGKEYGLFTYYYKSGNIPWVLSLVSIKNYGPKHAYVLRQIFNKMIRKKTKVYWLRHAKDMNLKSAAYGVTHVGRND